ncbi:MAG: hypothetical protein COX19_03265 [Desulfobacterales bacterium CG23_combo_of_CG06-09_8_20_14_all_51_8]|nr:MAG: hypothetical protein COX19_03265 [Desulfobacterales bacterium CG23_combo_of_CG06-09_8_20_14_all_51_8]
MRPAIEFEQQGSTLLLLYTARDDDSWVYDRFDRGEDLLIKGTFHFRREHLLAQQSADAPNDEITFVDFEPLRFRVVHLEGEYFSFDPEVLPIGYPLLIHRDAQMTWKWFTAEQRTSIFRVISEIRPKRIVIGGNEPDAIPEAEFEKLITNFPTGHELKRYVLARVAAVVREFSETQVDAERLFRKYVNKRLSKRTVDIVGLFRRDEEKKYRYLLDRLSTMLAVEETYPEAAWQAEILQIVLLLNPKYIKAIEHGPVRDADRGTTREIDILLIDASGNVDVIEIKKPFNKCIVTEGLHRDNHIPLRELSGSVMQVEKYLYYLNRWGAEGEEALTAKYREQLPSGFSIKITNPTGIIIIGRDNKLTEAQRRDFEVVKRKYKNIADIITYDELLRRLDFVIKQFSADA